MLVAIAIFLLFEKRVAKHKFSTKAETCIIRLSANSFGVYLIHALVLDSLAFTGISAAYPTPILMLPLLTVGTFLISNIAVELIRKIPSVGRLIT